MCLRELSCPDAFSGGTNPALRTFYYRLLRLTSLCIQPLFVFDGPNKPPFKRNKRTGASVASIPEYLAKELLKKFGLPYHLAPGEAEAECALLQREGLVDAVLSEDVDTLMFGSGKTMRNWSSEVASSKTPTHVNLYDAETVKSTSGGMDKDGMVLVALMSGGDYVPQGISGCGPKTACEAAKAGFGRDLCQIPRKDKQALERWREKLSYELRTNESHHFRSKHKALKILPEFPDKEVLGYYVRPAVSSLDQVNKLRTTIEWQQEPRINDLRTFTAEAFDWRCVSGAKKFIRNLAPVLLIRALTERAKSDSTSSDDVEATEKLERNLVQTISGKRTHQSTDNTPEFRVGFVPVDLVPIDLDAEPPDEPAPGPIDHQSDASDSATDAEPEHLADKSKEKRPLLYDPYKLEKLWIPETYVKVGVPLTVQDWEESFRNPKKYQAMKSKNKEADKTMRKKSSKTGVMRQGAIKQYANVKKSASRNDPPKSQDMTILDSTLTQALPSTKQSQTAEKTVIDLLSSPAPAKAPSSTESPSPAIKRRQRSSFQRTQTLPIHLSPEPPPHPCYPHSSPIPSLDLACSPVRKSPRNRSRKRMRPGLEDSDILAPGKLDSWLQKSQIHNSSGVQTSKSPVTELLPKTTEPTTSPKNVSNPLQDSHSTNIPKKPQPDSLHSDSENQPPGIQFDADEQVGKTFLASQTRESTDRSSRKRYVYPRRSLKGVWKVVADATPELQIVDLSAENNINTGKIGKKDRCKKAWRASQIDVLDMTDL